MNKALTIACTTAALAALLTGPATSASANAPCGTNVADKDGSAWPTATTTSNIRTGSSTGCTSVGLLLAGHRADYHCYTTTSTYTWTYLRDNATGKTGWVRDDLLPGGGSFVYCGF